MMNKKLFAATMGLIVGDAMGVPYEFMSPEKFVVQPKMVGYGTYNQPPGTWSDDTSMTLATIASFKDNKLEVKRIADNFLKWFKSGDFTPFGQTFDIGSRTKKALSFYDTYNELLLDNDINSNGNGSLMRILPVAFASNCSVSLIDVVSAITHPHQISKSCCRIYVGIIRSIALHNRKKIDLINELNLLNYIENDILNIEKILFGKPEDIISDGYVVNSLETALWAFFNSKSYEETILSVISLGFDTDTNAAIAGSIAALYYGINDIPKDWINDLVNYDYIEEIIKKSYK